MISKSTRRSKLKVANKSSELCFGLPCAAAERLSYSFAISFCKVCRKEPGGSRNAAIKADTRNFSSAVDGEKSASSELQRETRANAGCRMNCPLSMASTANENSALLSISL
ncbi:hypothetical protein D3C77_367890 [compost metagenome]